MASFFVISRVRIAIRKLLCFFFSCHDSRNNGTIMQWSPKKPQIQRLSLFLFPRLFTRKTPQKRLVDHKLAFHFVFSCTLFVCPAQQQNMKTRLTAIDFGAVCANLRETVLGMRVAQIYDINAKTYIIKLSKGEKKTQLLIESGIRLHRTAYQRDKGLIPSGFSIKVMGGCKETSFNNARAHQNLLLQLRKHIRTKKLNDVQQLGVDRVVDLTFGTGESAFHLIVEFYAAVCAWFCVELGSSAL
jgi:hypothetical protein